MQQFYGFLKVMQTGNHNLVSDIGAEDEGNKEASLDELVTTLIEQPYFKEGLARASVLNAFPGIIQGILGSPACSACRAIALRNDVLIIEATDNIWSQKIAMASEQILVAFATCELNVRPSEVEVRTRVG